MKLTFDELSEEAKLVALLSCEYDVEDCYFYEDGVMRSFTNEGIEKYFDNKNIEKYFETKRNNSKKPIR